MTSWDDFEGSLVRTVLEMPERTQLVIAPLRRRSLFVQFSGIEEVGRPDTVIAQLSPRESADHFTDHYLAELERLGFTETEYRYGGLWQRELPWPMLSQVARDTASACLLRLRDVGGLASPDQLCYRAWRDPQRFESASYEDEDPGEDDVAFDDLGLLQVPMRS